MIRWLPMMLLLACGPAVDERPDRPDRPDRPGAPTPAEPAPVWPAEGAPLNVLPVEVPAGFGVKKVYLDAGHGAPGRNVGNVGAFCQFEEEHTLEVANDLAERLRATGAFEVRVSRDETRRPRYQDRSAEAQQWGADALISIHSDARLADTAEVFRAPEGYPCRVNEGEHGFSVLYSDDGAAERVQPRITLARSLSDALIQAGFPPYLGDDYEGRYVLHPDQAGAWADRHEPGKRIYMLRAPQMPSVIIETHQALDREEVLRWQEERTHEAFASAVAVGLIDALRSEPATDRASEDEGAREPEAEGSSAAPDAEGQEIRETPGREAAAGEGDG